MSLWVSLSIDVDTGGEQPYTVELFEMNITHNLTAMAREARLYIPIWHPEDMGATEAGDIVEVMEEGLAAMKVLPNRFKPFSASNGWGTYEQFLPQVEEYLAACKLHPKARISAHG